MNSNRQRSSDKKIPHKKNKSKQHKSKAKSKTSINKTQQHEQPATKKANSNQKVNSNSSLGKQVVQNDGNTNRESVIKNSNIISSASHHIERSRNKLSKLQTNTNQSRNQSSKASLKSPVNISKRFKTENKSTQAFNSSERKTIIKRQGSVTKRLKTDLTDRIESPVLIQQRFQDDHHNTQSLAELLQFHTGYNQIDEQEFNDRVRRQKQQTIYNKGLHKIKINKGAIQKYKDTQREKDGQDQRQENQQKQSKANQKQRAQQQQQNQNQNDNDKENENDNQRQESDINIQIGQNQKTQDDLDGTETMNIKKQRQVTQSQISKAQQDKQKSLIQSHRTNKSKKSKKTNRSKKSKINQPQQQGQRSVRDSAYTMGITGQVQANINKNSRLNKDNYNFTKKPIIRSFSHEQKLKIINQAKYIPKTEEELRMELRFIKGQLNALNQVRENQEIISLMEQYKRNKTMILQQSNRKFQTNKLLLNIKFHPNSNLLTHPSVQFINGIKKSVSLPKIKPPVNQFVLPQPQQINKERIYIENSSRQKAQSQVQIDLQRYRKRRNDLQNSLSMSRLHYTKKQQILTQKKNKQKLLTQNNTDNIEHIQNVLRSKGVQFDVNAVRKGLTSLRTMPDIDKDLKFQYPKNLLSNPKYQKYPL